MEDYPRGLLELERRFSSEEACREFLAALRRPEGSAGSRCRGTAWWAASRERRICVACGCQTTVTAGTIFEGTRIALPVWFRAIWWMTNQKNGVRAMGLQRVCG